MTLKSNKLTCNGDTSKWERLYSIGMLCQYGVSALLIFLLVSSLMGLPYIGFLLPLFVMLIFHLVASETFRLTLLAIDKLYSIGLYWYLPILSQKIKIYVDKKASESRSSRIDSKSKCNNPCSPCRLEA